MAPGKSAAGPRASGKQPKKLKTQYDAEGERQALHIATGFAIQDAGLLENYDPAGSLLIKTPEIIAKTVERLDERARRAAVDLMAGRPVEQSLDLALYLASLNEYRVAGAVYVAYWDSVSALNDCVVAARRGLYKYLYATEGADAKKRLASEFTITVAIEFAKLQSEREREGRSLRDETCSTIAREIRARLNPRKSERSYWRYVRPLHNELIAR